MYTIILTFDPVKTQIYITGEKIRYRQAMFLLWVSQEPQRSWSAGPDLSLQQGMVSTAKDTCRDIYGTKNKSIPDCG